MSIEDPNYCFASSSGKVDDRHPRLSLNLMSLYDGISKMDEETLLLRNKWNKSVVEWISNYTQFNKLLFCFEIR
jgi:hypothetical protein